MVFALRARVRRLFRLPLGSPRAIDDDADRELDALIESRVEYYVRHGYAPDAARAEAYRRLGASLDEARAQLHHSARHREQRMHLRDLIESVVQDVRYTARGLGHRPGFTAVVVLTVAIGVGATTALFSAIDALLLRPLPYAQPNELMRVSLVVPVQNGEAARTDMVWSYPKYVVFRQAQHVFREIALYTGGQSTLADPPERVTDEEVGATYLRTLGLTPVVGRDFAREVDAHAGAPPEVILSYALWQARFNADPAVIGRVLEIDRQPFTIIGVAPRAFQGLTGQAQLFTPLMVQSQADLWQPYSHSYTMVARRAKGISAAQAEAATIAIGRTVNEVYGNRKTPWSAMARPLNDIRLASPVRRSLLVLFGAVGLLLLIGCVNVANLLLGRASARQREIALRVAIGAGRARLVQLFLTESLLLSLLGAVASMAVAWAGVRWLASLNPASTLRVARDSSIGAVAFAAITLRWSTLLFALGVSVTVGLVFGMAPVVGTARVSLSDSLRGERTSTALGAAMRRTLVMAEVALALVLLAGSALMVRSLAKLLSTNPGFDGSNVLTLRLTAETTPGWRDSIPSFYIQLLDRIRAVPGVADVGLSDCPPLNGGCNKTGLTRKDRPAAEDGSINLVMVHWASPTWFATMGVPLRRGRVFGTGDRAGLPQVAVINEQAAKQFWPGEDPIGKHISLGQGGYENAEIVGIVGGVRQKPDSEPMAEAYEDYAQSPTTRMMVFVKSKRDVASLTRDVRAAIHEIAPSIPVYDVQTMEERSDGATAQARFRAILLAVFALTALTLAAVGIYGVMALAVTARTRELGIRLALGAERGRVLRLVVGQGLAMVAVGGAAGLVGALMAARVLRSLLYELSPSDPITYLAITVVLGAVAFLASWVPARRAAAVDPVIALRAE